MIQLNEIAQCPLPIIKSWAAFVNPKMYTFRGSYTRIIKTYKLAI